MMDDVLLKKLKLYEEDFKCFMGIEEFPDYDLQKKIASVAVADKQGFEVAASAHYQVETKKHLLTISENLTLSKYLIFHEFTHILDSEMYTNGDKVRYVGLFGFTEYHASQIELLQLLGRNSVCAPFHFSMSDNIETFSGTKSVQQYVNDKQQHAIDLFSREDFPENINTLKSAIGVLYNYFGLRSICEMFAVDFEEHINNQAYLNFISTQQFTILNNLMHGWLDNTKIDLSINLYNGIMIPLATAYKLI